MKNRVTPEILCGQNEETGVLLPFMKEIFALDFSEKPDYKKLKFLLVQGILDQDLVPDEQYDWNWIQIFEAAKEKNIENNYPENHNFGGK